MKKWIVLLSLFLLPLKAHALTAAQIISSARIYLGDNSNSPTRQQFTDANLLSFLNDGVREANAQNWILQSTYAFALSGGTTEYALPDNFVATQRVLFNNKKIDATSLNELDANSVGWKTQNGTPIKYWLDYFVTPTNIGFYPAPVTSSTGPVIVYYVQQPTELTLTSQVPYNGWTMMTPYHSGLVYYICYRAYMAQEDMEKAPIYLNDWQISLQLMRVGLYKQPDFNPGMAGRREQ